MSTKTEPDLEEITDLLVGGTWLGVWPGTLTEHVQSSAFYHFQMPFNEDHWVNVDYGEVQAVRYKPNTLQKDTREKVVSLLNGIPPVENNPDLGEHVAPD